MTTEPLCKKCQTLLPSPPCTGFWIFGTKTTINTYKQYIENHKSPYKVPANGKFCLYRVVCLTRMRHMLKKYDRLYFGIALFSLFRKKRCAKNRKDVAVIFSTALKAINASRKSNPVDSTAIRESAVPFKLLILPGPTLSCSC